MPEISKTICIEMGHRLPKHQGKCCNLHGHSYRIEAFISGPLQFEGPSEGMVVDFTVLKEAMAKIDADFDHKMCLQITDPILKKLCPQIELLDLSAEFHADDYIPFEMSSDVDSLGQKYILLSQPPTAEVLAIIWRNIIVNHFNDDRYRFRLKVWETATSCVEVG